MVVAQLSSYKLDKSIFIYGVRLNQVVGNGQKNLNAFSHSDYNQTKLDMDVRCRSSTSTRKCLPILDISGAIAILVAPFLGDDPTLLFPVFQYPITTGSSTKSSLKLGSPLTICSDL